MPDDDCIMATGLNPKQLKFIEEYLRTGNATQAYINAGYKGRGRVAENNASRLLGNAGVRAAIDAARDKAAEKRELTAEWVAERTMIEATYYGDGASHAARVKAIELAAKFRGMLTEKVDVTSGGKPVEPTSVRVITPPARAAIVEYLRDVGLPCPGDVSPDGVGEPVDRGAGV